MGYDYDLVVIGSGPAGERGAVTAARLGRSVLVVDKLPEPGGAAVHTGTLPSKTLRETALFLSGREHREVYGLSIAIDRALFAPRLLSRKDAVVLLEVSRIRKALAAAGVSLCQGVARLLSPHEVEIVGSEGSRTVSAAFILVATGSYPHRPPEFPWGDRDIEDSDTILELDGMPETMCVLGGGVIGCEYASIFAALGVAVTLIDRREELLSFLDRDVSRGLLSAFSAAGIDVRLGPEHGAKAVTRQGKQLVVQLSGGAQLSCDKLLFCGGRNGASSDLGLEALGVAISERGNIVVDEAFRTGVPSVLAAGDVTGFPALASTSMEQARRAVLAAFDPENQRRQAELSPLELLLPYGIYAIPEVSCVGLSEEDAIEKGLKPVTGTGDFEQNARAKINGCATGFVKLVFDQDSRKLLGAHALGDRASELAHLGQAYVAMGASAESIACAVFNYPTLSECFKLAACDALARWPE